MRRESQGGYATVETALTLPALVAVAVLGLGAGVAGAAKVQVCEVARTAARGASVGVPLQDTAGAKVNIDTSGQWVKATATKNLAGPVLPAVTCRVSALKETELMMGIER